MSCSPDGAEVGVARAVRRWAGSARPPILGSLWFPFQVQRQLDRRSAVSRGLTHWAMVAPSIRMEEPRTCPCAASASTMFTRSISERANRSTRFPLCRSDRNEEGSRRCPGSARTARHQGLPAMGCERRSGRLRLPCLPAAGPSRPASRSTGVPLRGASCPVDGLLADPSHTPDGFRCRAA